jgi:hypothetical protein
MIEDVNFDVMKDINDEKREAPISQIMTKKRDKSGEVVEAKNF